MSVTVRDLMAGRLREARKRSGLSAAEVGNELGKSPKTVYSWESGQGQPDADTLLGLCRIYGMDIADFYGASRTVSSEGSYADIPLYGSIAAGIPIEMESVEGFIAIPESMHRRYPDAFLLTVQGESMNRRLPNGSYALVNPTAEAIDGRVYALCVNGYDATIKRVHILNNGFELVPDSTDPTFRPTVYDYGEDGTDTVTIIGEVVWCVFPYDYDF